MNKIKRLMESLDVLENIAHSQQDEIASITQQLKSISVRSAELLSEAISVRDLFEKHGEEQDNGFDI